jgi:hypothetical protein
MPCALAIRIGRSGDSGCSNARSIVTRAIARLYLLSPIATAEESCTEQVLRGAVLPDDEMM